MVSNIQVAVVEGHPRQILSIAQAFPGLDILAVCHKAGDVSL